MAAMQGSNWWSKGRKDMLAGMIGKYIGMVGGCRLLDIGCGTGSNIAALARIGKATGVDNSKTAVEYCRKTGIEARLGSALKLPFESCIFDVAVMADVLEHIGNEKKAIAEARRMLQKCGILIITVPAYQSLFSYHDRAVGHKRRYSKKNLEGLLGGFDVEYFSHFFSFALVPAVAARVVGTIAGARKSDSIPAWGVLEAVLSALGAIERKIMLCGVRMPFGTSIIIVAKKREGG